MKTTRISEVYFDFYNEANHQYRKIFPGLGTSDEFFEVYCMGNEL
jgi:hypothetical protein